MVLVWEWGVFVTFMVREFGVVIAAAGLSGFMYPIIKTYISQVPLTK